MPISAPRPMVQPCSTTLWPMVASGPMVSGKPGSVCRTQPSCTFARAPIAIGSLSPRATVPNQTLASSSMTMLPVSTALSATQKRPLAGTVTRRPSTS